MEMTICSDCHGNGFVAEKCDGIVFLGDPPSFSRYFRQCETCDSSGEVEESRESVEIRWGSETDDTFSYDFSTDAELNAFLLGVDCSALDIEDCKGE